MSALTHGRIGTALVAILLLIQVALFWLSLDALMQVSVFCTAPASSSWSLAFGIVHILLLALLLIGLLSMRFVRLRLAYIALVIPALLALPVQAAFVSNGSLWCDTF